MSDVDPARADVPGGDVGPLYRAIWRLLDLPPRVRLLLCHGYKAPEREDYVWETTIAARCEGNVQDGMDEDAFVPMCEAHDSTLAIPHLISPSIQLEIHGGKLPKPKANRTRRLPVALNAMRGRGQIGDLPGGWVKT